MTHRRSVTHEEITEQLERRAAGTRLLPDRREAILSKVALRTAHRRVGTPWSDLWTRIAAAFLVLVLGVTVLAGLAGGPASSPPWWRSGTGGTTAGDVEAGRSSQGWIPSRPGPEPSTAPPGSAEATLTDLVVRAESADPDTDLPPEEARSLVSTARKWLLDPEHGGPGLGDRPLAPFSVERVGDRARVWFHDLGDGRTIMAVLEMEGGQPVALLDVTVSDLGTATLLSTWERDEARAIALRETEYGSMPGTRTGIPAAVACPDADGLCASVPMLRDESLVRHFAEVIVDIGRVRVLDDVLLPPRE